MENFLKDLRYGARLLIKSPWTSAVSIFALTLGIGLTATMFSIVYGALFRGLPFPESDRIMHLEENNLPAGIQGMEVPIHDMVDWREQQRSFEELGAFYTGTVNVSGTERAERYNGGFMTANAFRILRVSPVLGRGFQEGEDTRSAPPVVLISHELWKNRYDSDPDIIGKAMRANGEPMTIVGVMPPRFSFPIDQQIWLPLRLDPLQHPRRTGQSLEVFGRLKEGVTIDQAMVEFDRIAKRIAAEHPQHNTNIGVAIKPFTREYIGDDVNSLLYTMLGAVFFVLLIACANVANLLLGRAILRSREVGIRTALGASRWRLVTQFLSEALVLSLAGAVLGTALAWLGVRLFNNAIAPTDPPFWIDIRIDRIALTFVIGLSLLCTFFAGVIPAIQASSSKVSDVLKDESRGASSFRLGRISRGLVIFEMALSCGLLVASGLTIKSVAKLRTIDLGFDITTLFTARIGLPEINYPDSAAQVRFYDQLLARLPSVPGMRSVALTSSLPGAFGGWTILAIEGQTYDREQEQPGASRIAVSENYFATLGLAPLNGREFNSGDRAGSLPVVIINRSMAEKYFASTNPIGQRIRLGPSATGDRPWLSIIGVVPDAYAGGIQNDEPEAVYVPFAQHPARFMSIIARVPGQPLSVTPDVRDLVTAIDRDIPLYFVQTVPQAIEGNTWFYRIFGGLFMIFGFAALFLASIGLYAVMAFSVSQRTREVGIRMAIGAQARDVLSLILRQGLVQVALGMVVGLIFAAALSRLLSVILFGVNPRDPVIYAAIVVVLSCTALLACYIPARRATRVQPNQALRYD